MRWQTSPTLAAWCLVGILACSSDERAPDSALPEDSPTGDEFGPYARGGIELHRVTADQGVEIPIFDEGLEIPVDERDSELVAGRPMLLRGFWSIPDDWQVREIEARLVLRYQDGHTEIASRKQTIDRDSVPAWFEGTFSFYVPAELVQGGMKFDLTLYEVEDVGDDALPPAVAPRLPLTGSSPLAPDPSPREIEVVIVPIDHQYDGGKMCPDLPPAFDAERLQGFADALYVQNPVQSVTVTAREQPLVWSESAADLSKILDALGDLRVEDDAPPWVYYYGAIEPCDWGSDDGFAGLAFLPKETTKAEAWRRVSLGDLAVSETSTKETFVHEIGHNQERRHVPCGNPKGAVDDYPFRDGLTAIFGFDLLEWSLHRPTSHDYMSYCGPSWSSHYGWNEVLPVSAELTSWKLEGASAIEPEPQLLVGAIYTDGSTRWMTRPGDPTATAPADASVEYWHEGVRLETAPMHVEPRQNGALELTAPLPAAGLDAVSHVRLLDAPVDATIRREQIHAWGAGITR